MRTIIGGIVSTLLVPLLVFYGLGFLYQAAFTMFQAGARGFEDLLDWTKGL